MTGIQPVSDAPSRDGELRPLIDHSADPPPTPEGPTAFQKELSAALGDESHSTHINDRPEGPGVFFWDVALGTLGIVSLLVGVVLVFFFAAIGAIVLLLGALVCAMAFTGATRVGEGHGKSAWSREDSP